MQFFKVNFTEFLFVTMVYIHAFCGLITYKMKVLLGVCGFVVNVCENLAIFVFNKDVKKW